MERIINLCVRYHIVTLVVYWLKFESLLFMLNYSIRSFSYCICIIFQKIMFLVWHAVTLRIVKVGPKVRNIFPHYNKRSHSLAKKSSLASTLIYSNPYYVLSSKSIDRIFELHCELFSSILVVVPNFVYYIIVVVIA